MSELDRLYSLLEDLYYILRQDVNYPALTERVKNVLVEAGRI